MPDFSCCTNETAERFAMNRLGPVLTDLFEEHLLICSPCLNRVEETAEYVAAFRAAIRTYNP